jgi:hypothetical protein
MTNKIKKIQIFAHRKGPRPSTNTTYMYEKSTTHVNRTYSQTYWFIYLDSRTDILYFYTQLVLMNCTSVYTTHINGIHTHTHGHCTLYRFLYRYTVNILYRWTLLLCTQLYTYAYTVNLFRPMRAQAR